MPCTVGCMDSGNRIGPKVFAYTITVLGVAVPVAIAAAVASWPVAIAVGVIATAVFAMSRWGDRPSIGRGPRTQDDPAVVDESMGDWFTRW